MASDPPNEYRSMLEPVPAAPPGDRTVADLIMTLPRPPFAANPSGVHVPGVTNDIELLDRRDTENNNEPPPPG